MRVSSAGFAPIARRDALVLILGSLPGQRSLQARQYYAHPQNAFWRIMRDLIGAQGSYEQRCNALLEHRIALWDVLAHSVRPGSMDADIQLSTSEANDFPGFLRVHTDIEVICFNGRKAAQMFRRFVVANAEEIAAELVTLPSTSAAYASMPYAKKLECYYSALSPVSPVRIRQT
jgi:hypoxanthine-DNA glycosylase